MTTLAGESLNSCAGCEIALLNLGETLLDLLPQIQIVHLPVLVDNKYYGQLGQSSRLTLPKAVVGLVSGGIRNTEHLELLHTMREQVDVLVALGTCAATGGLPALANLTPETSITEFSFTLAPSLAVQGPNAPMPQPKAANLPEILPQCLPLSAHVKVDMVIPGCPPHPEWIAEGILSLLEGRPAAFPSRSVCSSCPTWRKGAPGSGKEGNRPVRRMLEQPSFDPEAPLSSMQCLLEQGFMCLGPVTLAGCGGRTGNPKCIAARTPCRGCQGPALSSSIPSVEYVAALTVAGFNGTTMPDKPGYTSRFNAACDALLQLRDATRP